MSQVHTESSPTRMAPRGGASRAPFQWARFAESFALVGALLILFAIFGILKPQAFLSWANISTMLGSQAVLVLLTLALIIPLTAGDFDLSIAATLTMSAMTIAVLNAQMGIPLAGAVAVAIAIGAIIGCVNAGFILYFRIPSLIVTLGTGTFINGLVLWISNSNTISGIDPFLVTYVVVTRVFGIPLAFYYALGLCILLWYFFGFTAAGRRLLFVGRGREVARLSGIPVDRVRFAALVCSGVLSAITGMMYAGTIGAADPNSGNTFLLPAFAAAFLGATSITPGRFNAWGSLVAVYFLVIGITGLTMLGIDTFVQNLFYGGALVLAVALSQLVRKREAQDFS
ncbi:ABC transporter permease [Kaistia dalseonensis]|uniref:Ribose transport system permease protein n=1 Tax=Kaistia dalseonensis TaxID=410840 RepID=A0ABU0H429_9HYPH|nr:ABC transporter permease [Kaistia dalseonensis]MCX5494480.1 ABC transporter permease [Kaistia dalseonensis]MDQ0437059.1 ribose transport system permease protein [Kaistia dalseonensis]